MLKQLELLANSITTDEEGIGIVDEDGKFVWVNEFLGKIYGCSSEDLDGQYFTNGFPEEDAIKVWQSHYDLLAGKLSSYPPTSVTYHGQGVTKRLTLSGRLAFPEDKKRYCLLFMQEEQSHHDPKVDQKRLDGLFYSLVESENNYFIRTDLDGKYLLTNHAYERKFGPKKQYESYEADLHPSDIAKYKQALLKCIRHPETPIPIKLRKIRERDTYYIIQWELVGVTNAQGQVVEIQGIGQDVTDKEEARQRIQWSNRFNRLLLDISIKFVDNGTKSPDRTINEALGAITRFINFKWAMVYLPDASKQRGRLAYQYALSKAHPLPEVAREILLKRYPWWREKVDLHESIVVYDSAALSELAVREKFVLYALRIKSLLAIPIVHQNELNGYVVFTTDSFSKQRIKEISEPLKLLTTILGTTFYQMKLNEALTESRSKYKLLADNVADMVSKHDLQGIYNYVSPSCEALTGYQQHELLGKSAFDQIHPDDQAKAIEHLKYIISGESIRYQYRKRRKDGEYRWMEISAKLVEENNRQEIIASTRDIHHRKMTEDSNIDLLKNSQRLNEELQTSQETLQVTLERTQELNELLLKSEKKFRSLTEKSFDAIAVYSADGLITYATPSVESVIGYTPEELIGTYRWDYILPEDAPEARRLLANSLRHPHQRLQGFTRLIRKDGEIIWTETIMTNLLLDENIKGVVSNFRDVTRQRKGEQDIAEYSGRLSIATQAASIGIWDWYLREDYLVWDERTLAMFGVSSDHFNRNKESWMAVVHPEDRERLEREIERALHSEQGLDTEYRIVRPDNQEQRFIKASAKITQEDGEPSRITGAFLDITMVKQVEQQLRENNQALQKTNAELDQFVYSTSHNLRAPLASILGLIAVLQGTTNSEERVQYLQLIESSIHRLDETIHEIIDYSRNARTDLNIEEVHFQKIIADILDSLYFLRSTIDIKINLDIPENFTFHSDPVRLKTIFNNLISNAFKYFNPHAAQPFVTIEVEPVDEGIKISVQDNGVGINRGAQDKIFNMFYRASHQSSGSGLGLYIVREAVHKLGGTITMDSVEGQGTTFVLQLPVLPA